MTTIPGYTKHDPNLPAAPISMDELQLLCKSLLLGDGDIQALRQSRAILEPQVHALLDVWYGFVGSNPHLLRYFSNAAGQPQPEYLDRVRARFSQWVLDTADAQFDEGWLRYQFEIGSRHHSIGKNRTDNADAAPIIHLRHLIALAIPVSATLRPFLAQEGVATADVDAMQDAWRKAVLLSVILWSYPYVGKGEF